MRRTRAAGAAAAVCLSLLAAACSSGEEDKSAEEIRTDLVRSLQDGDEDLDDETAECFADVIIDEVGLEQLREVELADRSPEDGLDDDIVTAAKREADECDSSGQ